MIRRQRISAGAFTGLASDVTWCSYSPTVWSALSRTSAARYMPASCSSRSSKVRAEGMRWLQNTKQPDDGDAFLDGKPSAFAFVN